LNPLSPVLRRSGDPHLNPLKATIPMSLHLPRSASLFTSVRPFAGLPLALLGALLAAGGGCDREESASDGASASEGDTVATTASTSDDDGAATGSAASAGATAGATSGTGDTSDEPGSSAGATATGPGNDTDLPAPGSVAAECVAAGATPRSSAACGEAMRDHCLQFSDRDSCVSDLGLAAASGVYRCGWFRVVTYDAACTPGAESFRCEAGEVINDEAGCRSRCPPSGIYGPTAWPETGELIVASDDGCVTGPIGPWSAFDAQDPARDPGDPSHCGGGETLPPAPPLCDCAAAFCAAP